MLRLMRNTTVPWNGFKARLAKVADFRITKTRLAKFSGGFWKIANDRFPKRSPPLSTLRHDSRQTLLSTSGSSSGLTHHDFWRRSLRLLFVELNLRVLKAKRPNREIFSLN